MDSRAVSTHVGYTLSLALTAVLISGLLIAAGGVVESRQEQAIRSELVVVGERIAADLMAADRLVVAGGTEVRLTVSLPEEVAGTGYRITLNRSPPTPQIVLTSGDPAVTVTVPFETTTPVVAGTVRSGDVQVVLTPNGTLEVRSA